MMNKWPLLPHQRNHSDFYSETPEDYVNPIEKIACSIDDIISTPWKCIRRIKKLVYNFSNRNSLHTDVSWEISRNKSTFKRLLDSYKWIKDDDSGFYYQTIVNWSYLQNMTTYYEYNWLPFTENWEVNDISPSDRWVSILREDGVYKPKSKVKIPMFVKIKDKGSYIEEKKRDLLWILKNELITDLLFTETLTFRLRDYFSDIRDFLDYGYITEDEIKTSVKVWLRNRCDKAFSKINRENKELDSLDVWIIGWGILNWAFLEPIIVALENKTWKSRNFFTKYIEDINYEDLIFDLIIKKS